MQYLQISKEFKVVRDYLSDNDFIKYFNLIFNSLEFDGVLSIFKNKPHSEFSLRSLLSESTFELFIELDLIEKIDSIFKLKEINFSIITKTSNAERLQKSRERKKTVCQSVSNDSQNMSNVCQNVSNVCQVEKTIEKTIENTQENIETEKPKKEKKTKQSTAENNEVVDKIYNFYRGFLIQKSRTTPKAKPFIAKLLLEFSEGEICNAVSKYMEEHKKALSEGKDFVKGGERFFNEMIRDYIEKGEEIEVAEITDEIKTIIKNNRKFLDNVNIEKFLQLQQAKKKENLTVKEQFFLSDVYKRMVQLIKQDYPKKIEEIYNESVEYAKENQDPFM